MPGDEADDLLTEDDDKVRDVTQTILDGDSTSLKKRFFPLRILPKSQKGRMIAQEARFTLHPPQTPPLEDFTGKAVWKLRVPSSAKRGILEELRMLGVHKGVLFPEPSKLAEELRRQARI